jgi:hypothetical protein
MTTGHVLEQLPLWVERDLDPQDTEAIEIHLAHCPACRVEAERLRTSQAWLREALGSPFEASDQVQLRRAVMAQIRSEPPRRPVRRLTSRPAFLAACAATLLVAVGLLLRLEPPGRTLPPVAGPSTAAPPPAVAPAQPEPPRPRALRPQARAAPNPRALHPPRAPAAPDREEPARIEFQTADPTIRIIWLAQTKPLPNTNPSLEEKS